MRRTAGIDQPAHLEQLVELDELAAGGRRPRCARS
jgi:hypothetical protein